MQGEGGRVSSMEQIEARRHSVEGTEISARCSLALFSEI